MGPPSTDGYGRFRCTRPDGEQAIITPHRAAAELAYGPAPVGFTHLHECEVRMCCRPDPRHLRLGTQAENIQQAVDRGRRTLSGDMTGGLGPVALARALQAALREATGSPEQLAEVLAGVLAGHRATAGTTPAWALFEI